MNDIIVDPGGGIPEAYGEEEDESDEDVFPEGEERDDRGPLLLKAIINPRTNVITLVRTEAAKLVFEITLDEVTARRWGFLNDVVKRVGNIKTVLRPSTQQWQATLPPNPNFWCPNTIALYTNFIDYSNMGGVETPVLKLIPVTNEPSKFTIINTFEPRNDEFHRVSYSQLSDLKFHMRTLDGQLVRFKDPNHNLIITLKFKITATNAGTFQYGRQFNEPIINAKQKRPLRS